MAERNFERIDQVAEIQDRVLDDHWDWLQGLPVEEKLREDIFHQLCVITGRVLTDLMKADGDL